MNDDKSTGPSATEDLTGLAWPKTWNGAYLCVLCSFIIWLALLTAIGVYCK